MIKLANILIKKAHENQRWGEYPYIHHLNNVLEILEHSEVKDKDILTASLLHDIIEDTKFTYDDIKKLFNKKIADYVQEVTKTKEGKFNIKSKGGLIIKLADTLHNIINSNDKEYINKKIKLMFS